MCKSKSSWTTRDSRRALPRPHALQPAAAAHAQPRVRVGPGNGTPCFQLWVFLAASLGAKMTSSCFVMHSTNASELAWNSLILLETLTSFSLSVWPSVTHRRRYQSASCAHSQSFASLFRRYNSSPSWNEGVFLLWPWSQSSSVNPRRCAAKSSLSRNSRVWSCRRTAQKIFQLILG